MQSDIYTWSQVEKLIKQATKKEKNRIKRRLLNRFEAWKVRTEFLSVGKVIHDIKEVIK